MNDIDLIINLDKKFFEKFDDILIDENNLEKFIEELNDYGEKRNEMINNLNFDELRKELSDEQIKSCIYTIAQNQNKIKSIVSIGQSICRKNLTNINKMKKIQNYSDYYSNESNFIDIVK